MRKRLVIGLLTLACCGMSSSWAQETTAQDDIKRKLAAAVNPFPEAFFHYEKRGSLSNSFAKFHKGGKARVAFLGGSITEMRGWKDMMEDYLKATFPQTDFDFVEAGIPSCGSTPHSFRMKTDVFKNGDVDLLFVEAAVNDDTNGFTPIEQVRGMEGMVRQAWLKNPMTDIIMLHFTWDGFLGYTEKNYRPEAVLNHERVANHYLVPSIDYAREMGERMAAGQFTWKDFGGTHPGPLGHQLYTATIKRLLSEMWGGLTGNEPIVAHEMPAKPLDEYSYFNGEFLDIHKAKLQKGWQIVEAWHPDNKYSKREGFVDVPMLETTKAGSRLTLDFEGKAIGIFCVAGPMAGILEYSVDGAPFKQLDTYTYWSNYLYIPWVYMFETELAAGPHKLVLRMARDKNKGSLGNECQIRNFVVNK